jgi:uncharacterized OB-fold protein
MTERPVPVVDDLNRPFWEGVREGVLRLQRCGACRHLRYPIATVCPVCLSRDADWEQVSGRASVHSTVVFHQVYNPAFAEQGPYNVAIVELEEGPRLMSNVVGIPPSSVRVGDAVRMIATEIADGVSIPQFEPVP